MTGCTLRKSNHFSFREPMTKTADDRRKEIEEVRELNGLLVGKTLIVKRKGGDVK